MSRPWRIVMVQGEYLTRWSYGFASEANAQREVDRLNARPDEYRDGWTAEVRGPRPASATSDGPQAVAPKHDCARCVALTDALRDARCDCINCGYRAAFDTHDRALASSVKQEKEGLGGHRSDD